MENEMIKTLGYKYQIGFYFPNGSYRRFSIAKKKPTTKKLEKIASENNVKPEDLCVQVIQ